MLKQAACDFVRLPEAAEAARLWAGPMGARALPLLERAVQVVEAVPIPALRLVAHGALAQVERSQGKLKKEAAQWEKASAATRSGPPELHLHAVNGAAICALSRGDAGALARACASAAQSADRLASDGEEAAARRWRLTFQTHETLDGLLGAQPTTAVGLALRAEVEAAAASATPSLHGLHQASLLLLGDARRAAGADPTAAEVTAPWEAVLRVVEEVHGGQSGGQGGGGEEGSDGASWVLRGVAAHWRLHHAAVDASDSKRSREAAEAAAELAKAYLPPLHPCLLGSVARLGLVMAEAGDAISAEGLYRSATDDLAKVVAGGAEGTQASWRPAASVELHSSLLAYASLLSRVEWNGKSRVVAAAALHSQAQRLAAGEMAQILATAAAREHVSGVAGGAVEMWYGATTGLDMMHLVWQQLDTT